MKFLIKNCGGNAKKISTTAASHSRCGQFQKLALCMILTALAGGSVALDENGSVSALELDVADSFYVDQICADYCNKYFNEYCSTSNNFLAQERIVLQDQQGSRALLLTAEDDLARHDTVPVDNAIVKCQRSCMLWPRGVDPAKYNMSLYAETNGDVFNSNLGGDTFWCRKRHMTLAVNKNAAVVHCNHASNTGGGICRDALVDGFTPYESLRDGHSTRRHFGYCDLAGDDTIADCTNNFDITDGTLPLALKMLPGTVKTIFLNGNPGITRLDAKIFSSNLKNPAILNAIYANDCEIGDINEDALRGLTELLIFNIDDNPVKEIPKNLLQDNPKLLQFSMANSGISEVPVNLFKSTKDIERIILFGAPLLTELAPGLFDGLTKLQFLSLVFCGFHDDSFPAGLFKDLVSLQFFDMFGNQLTKVQRSWFDGGWAGNILRLFFHEMSTLATIEEGVFDSMDSLEVATFHDTGISYIDPAVFKNNKKLVHVTVGSKQEELLDGQLVETALMTESSKASSSVGSFLWLWLSCTGILLFA